MFRRALRIEYNLGKSGGLHRRAALPLFSEVVMKKWLVILGLAAAAFGLAACSAGEGDDQAAARAVEQYLAALAAGDLNALANLVCAAWEEDARIETEAFLSLSLPAWKGSPAPSRTRLRVRPSSPVRAISSPPTTARIRRLQWIAPMWWCRRAANGACAGISHERLAGAGLA